MNPRILERKASNKIIPALVAVIGEPNQVTIPALTVDAPKKKVHGPKLTRAEKEFNRSLRGIAEHVGRLITSFEAGNVEELPTIIQLLESYADALVPWATQTVRRMLWDVNGGELAAWRSLSFAISEQLHKDIVETPIGDVMRALLHSQVQLIRSIPIEAAQRVHELTLKGLENSLRAEAYIAEIRRSGDVTKARATMIARTEIARTASILTQARSEHAGITHYRWQTAKDADVRPGHKAMQGKICEWANPPAVVENGRVMHFHPGRIWNCRCYPEPIVELNS
jgi:SPP1 gp7 family putative phage head morphogenesis protein